MNIKVVINPNKLNKLTILTGYDSFCIFSEDLAAICMTKTKLYLNRPIYVYDS